MASPGPELDPETIAYDNLDESVELRKQDVDQSIDRAMGTSAPRRWRRRRRCCQ
jgi:hypothetical protein